MYVCVELGSGARARLCTAGYMRKWGMKRTAAQRAQGQSTMQVARPAAQAQVVSCTAPLTVHPGCCVRSLQGWGPSWRARTAGGVARKAQYRRGTAGQGGRWGGMRMLCTSYQGAHGGLPRAAPCSLLARAPRLGLCASARRKNTTPPGPARECNGTTHLRSHHVGVLALVHQRLYEPQRHLLHAAGAGPGNTVCREANG